MFYPDLHAIGLDYPQWDGLMDEIMDQELAVVRNLPDAELVLSYQDSSGAQLTIVGHGQEEGFSTQSGFAAATGTRAEVFRFNTALAHVTFLDGEDQPRYATLATMRDPFRYPLVVNEEGASSVLVEQLGVAGLAVSCTFADSMAELRSPENADEVARALVCPSLDALMGGEITLGAAEPVALVLHEIHAVRREVNSLTAQPFWVAEGQVGDVPWTLVFPGDIDHEPKAGEVVAAEVLVSVGVIA